MNEFFFKKLLHKSNYFILPPTSEGALITQTFKLPKTIDGFDERPQSKTIKISLLKT